ncbi:MAG TPA: D-alanyl-D-alanine carboxypeptidase [Daejeonella sp.]|nr:D-alanyl-D-alanine carboxypeptidase [Daejeonella sp.]
MKLRYLLFLSIALLLAQNLDAKPIRPRKIRKLLKHSEVLQTHFTGFALYDIQKQKMLVEQLSDKYFTPASNTKLYTFYAGLKLLKDSLPGVQYIIKNDSLIFWGAGDPTFLHPDFADQPILNKLKNSGKKLYWAAGRYQGDFYGMGWSYDDYNEYYQPEISELPLYGNVIRTQVQNNTLVGSPTLSPNGIFKLITDSTKTSGRFSLRRDIFSNEFYKPAVPMPITYRQEIPFKADTATISRLLKANLPNYAGIIHYSKPAQVNTWYGAKRDSVLKHMMLPSDNFIAEQLLLSYAVENKLPMSAEAVIDHMLKNFLTDLPDKPQWVDGSGLSRQDLFTPRDMVKLCEKIYQEIGNEAKLFDFLPQGGKSGTLRNLYKSADGPFVFAKTGSLSNNHNLSGFLKTRSGKTLIFSFMNNNYVRPTADVRSEMERIITYIHQNY